MIKGEKRAILVGAAALFLVFTVGMLIGVIGTRVIYGSIHKDQIHFEMLQNDHYVYCPYCGEELKENYDR